MPDTHLRDDGNPGRDEVFNLVPLHCGPRVRGVDVEGSPVTLLVTEIMPWGSPWVVFAADRRVSLDDKRHTDRRKIIPVPDGRAAVGYFGIACLKLRGGPVFLDTWLSDFVNTNRGCSDLVDLAKRLANELNRIVDAGTRSSQASGFHVAGLNGAHQPEFWFVRNVKDDRTTFLGTYHVREDFQSRDLLRVPMGELHVYRNGDLRAHSEVWDGVDSHLGPLLSRSPFRRPWSPKTHMMWVQFKLGVVADFYKLFYQRSSIGRPIDALVITREGMDHTWGRQTSRRPRLVK